MKKFLALMLATIVLMIGCGNEQSEKPAKQVTIAMLSIANDEGIARAWYDEQLGKELGAKVIKLDYDSGMLANEAMATGNIDIALVGSTAAALGISKGLPYQVFWIHSIDGDNEALVVKNSSGIPSILMAFSMISVMTGKRINCIKTVLFLRVSLSCFFRIIKLLRIFHPPLIFFPSVPKRLFQDLVLTNGSFLCSHLTKSG